MSVGETAAAGPAAPLSFRERRRAKRAMTPEERSWRRRRRAEEVLPGALLFAMSPRHHGVSKALRAFLAQVEARHRVGYPIV